MEDRLDTILKRKAEDGVHIYILIWKVCLRALSSNLQETKIAVPIDSYHTKTIFEGLHRNIHVIRHPMTVPINCNPFSSLLLSAGSHHQKSVVVDQDIAIIGGADLCYGRWDTCEHEITDTTKTLFLIESKDDTSFESEDHKSHRILSYLWPGKGICI
jgi:phospholipase D1/2